MFWSIYLAIREQLYITYKEQFYTEKFDWSTQRDDYLNQVLAYNDTNEKM